MNTVKILKDARALIADEKNWMRGEYFGTQSGGILCAGDPEADCFCSIGAIAHATKQQNIYDVEQSKAVKLLLNCIEDEQTFYSVAAFNDAHEHADVIALFDRAIARAEREVA